MDVTLSLLIFRCSEPAMASRTRSTIDFLQDIDASLVDYAQLLIEKGFTNTRVLAHLTYEDIMDIPIGPRRLLINEVTKIRSPHSKSLLACLDAQTIQNQTSNLSDPATGERQLGRKELFPTPSTPETQRVVDPQIESHHYSSPMEKHLAKLFVDIESKQGEIEKFRSKIEERNKVMAETDIDTRPSCSRCHVPGHKIGKCTQDKCMTSISCGKMRLHKNELKEVDALKSELKKLQKDEAILQSECEKVQDSINSNNKCFSSAIRGYLINSNKTKYLIKYGDQVVPITRIVNIDIQILQRYYNNRVPDDLMHESENFDSIIAMHSSKFGQTRTSINSKLLDSVRRIDTRISQSPEINQRSFSDRVQGGMGPPNRNDFNMDQNPNAHLAYTSGQVESLSTQFGNLTSQVRKRLRPESVYSSHVDNYQNINVKPTQRNVRPTATATYTPHNTHDVRKHTCVTHCFSPLMGNVLDSCKTRKYRTQTAWL